MCNGWHLSRRCATLQNGKVHIPHIAVTACTEGQPCQILFRSSVFLCSECMSKVTVLCNIYFNNMMSIQSECLWLANELPGNENSPILKECAVKNSTCDVAKLLMLLQDSWQTWQPGAYSDTTTQFVSPPKCVKRLHEAIEVTLSGGGDFDFCNTPEP